MDYLCQRIINYCCPTLWSDYEPIELAPERDQSDNMRAGILFYYKGNILLLRRNSFNNMSAWDFPGGRLDEVDFVKSTVNYNKIHPDHMTNPISNDELYGAGCNSASFHGALREATEELGILPSKIKIMSSKVIYRSSIKRYTLFLAVVESINHYVPRLSPEHDMYGWFPAYLLLQCNKSHIITLHPWITEFISQHDPIWTSLCQHYRDAPRLRHDAWNSIADQLHKLSGVKAEQRGNLNIVIDTRSYQIKDD